MSNITVYGNINLKLLLTSFVLGSETECIYFLPFVQEGKLVTKKNLCQRLELILLKTFFQLFELHFECLNITKNSDVMQTSFFNDFVSLLTSSAKVEFNPEKCCEETVICSYTSGTGKFRSHCSRDWEAPGSSKPIAHQFARRYLSAASSNFFDY